MIGKGYQKTHGDSFTSGGGRPFEMREYKSPAKDDAERNTPLVIHLSDLNKPGKSAVNFSRKAGRTLDTFTKYWTEHDEDSEYDIE